jgi:hypothetical protein
MKEVESSAIALGFFIVLKLSEGVVSSVRMGAEFLASAWCE